MAIKILLLTQWFDPEPTFKGLVFARELVRLGFEVEVLTGFPNYPAGKLYPGYKLKLVQREIVDGVHVTRVPLYPSHDGSAIKRVLNYISFANSALIYGIFRARRPDVIYAYHPPLTVGITAALIRIFRGVPVVYDVQDLWPDTLRATGMILNQRVLSLVGAVCNWVYRRVDQLIVLSPGFKRTLIGRGVPASKIEVIYNWCSESALASPISGVPEVFPGADKFRIVFAGNLGKAQALNVVLDAAMILEKVAPNVFFVLIGGGVEVENLRGAASEKSLTNVVFLPQVPMDEIGAILCAADALLVHLQKDPLFEITIPSKTQAYMCVGKPILMAVDGDAAALVLESGCGVVAESGNAVSIANAALSLWRSSPNERDAMAEAGRRYYQENLSIQVGVRKFGRIFDLLAERSAKV